MAKRFIDTDLFRKPFVRSMQAPYKVLWIYLLCECDHAGIWDVELDVAAMRLGIKLDPPKVVSAMGSAIVQIDGGKKWWLPEFVAFQYGHLNPANKVHASVISLLSKHGIDPNKQAPYEDHASPLQGAKDKEMEEDMDMAMETDKEEGVQGEHARKGPDPDVQGVVGYLIQRLRDEGVAQSLDGEAKLNRWAAKSLILKLRKDHPEQDALTNARALIDAAMLDPFHRKNSTTFRYLFNNCGKIAANYKQANDPKQPARGDRQTDPAVAAANADEYFARKRASREAQPASGAQPQGTNAPDRAA